MGNTVKICTIQGGPCTRNIKDNIKQHLEYLRLAVEQYQPQLVLFSEYTVVPAFCGNQSPDNFAFAQTIPGEASNAFGAAAKKYGIYVCVNIFEDCGNGLYYNTSPIFGSDGKIVAGHAPDGSQVSYYQKVHIPSSMDSDGTLRANEKTYFHPGVGPAVFDTDIGRIGILICWDKRYTELWRIYGMMGAQIVLNPMCTWGSWRGSTYPDEMRIMALYNQYYVAGVGKGGTECVFGEKTMSGGSIICGPDGSVIAQAPSEGGRVLCAELDLDKVKQTRILTPVYRDRRPDIYGILSKE